MNPARRRVLIVAIIFLGLGGWFLHSRRSGTSEERAGAAPVASVRVTALREGDISQEIVVLGTVVPLPGAARSLTTGYECRIKHVDVAAGQRVAPGEALVEIEPSPDTVVKYHSQEALRDSTRISLASAERRFALRLATNADLAQARQAFREADAMLDALRDQGMAPAGRVLRAASAGVVEKIDAQEGAIVPAGTAVLTVVPEVGVEVKIGIEEEDAGRLHGGEPVTLAAVNRPGSTTGSVRVVGTSVDASTRLVDVRVSVARPADLRLGESVRARITAASHHGLIAPRAAVLPEAGHQVLFTIEKGHARKRTVRLGLENGKEVEIQGEGITAGEPVVVLGNYELEDGMAVKIDRSP